MNRQPKTWAPQFRLRSLLVAFSIISIAIVVIMRLEQATLSASLRNDLKLSPQEQLSVLETTRIENGHQKGLEHALIVITDSKEFRLAQASRWKTSNPNLAAWSIDSVGVSHVDGICRWTFFERTFEHYPTKKEINEFKTWIERW